MKFQPLLAALFLVTSVHAADEPTNKPAYPLTTCVVSGDKLGAMGAPVVLDYKGTEVHFCCHDCVATFKENPAKYLAKLPSANQK